jgi:hypothetical protein
LRPLGKKKVDSLSTTYLDEALADFSGYLAIDELYDGPFCKLSVVDNRRYNRLAFRVLEHKPTRQDVRVFLSEFKAQLDKRGLSVRGLTTDGSPLYPKVLKELWPDVPHQRCRFHVLKEIVQAVLKALAKLRKEMKAKIPKQRRGRPSKTQRTLARRIKRLKKRVAELFKHRYLFARHHLSVAQKKLLKKMVRGLPQLRALRAIMDEVYRLFDRRCRMATALGRLDKLRRRVRRFKQLRRTLAKLNSPVLEKALLFLDDKLLGSTSNAVERSNRRFRKAQQSVYSVRTKPHLEQRLALDMHRELRAPKRAQTLKALRRDRDRTQKTLHLARSDPDSDHWWC